MQFYQAYKQQV